MECLFLLNNGYFAKVSAYVVQDEGFKMPSKLSMSFVHCPIICIVVNIWRSPLPPSIQHGLWMTTYGSGFLSFLLELRLELRPPGLVDFTLAAQVDPSNERRLSIGL